MYTTAGIYYFSYMIDCCPVWVIPIISTNCFLHTVVAPDDWSRYARNM